MRVYRASLRVLVLLKVMLESVGSINLSADSNIMRPVSFDSTAIQNHLRKHKIATLPQLKKALGANADLTVFRKLRQLDYLSSYSHSGRFYSLPSIVRFDEEGLWSFQNAWFSRFGTLLSTLEAFVNRSPKGYLAEELARALHVEVHESLRQLVEQGRLARTETARRYLYTSAHPTTRKEQLHAQAISQTLPLSLSDSALLSASPDELKAAILLFYGLLDEQQRRLYAGIESLRLGHGGDALLAQFLDLDPHTVARGRQQLLDQDVSADRVRHPGAGRKLTEKKRPK
jgi:hypothetical protein